MLWSELRADCNAMWSKMVVKISVDLSAAIKLMGKQRVCVWGGPDNPDNLELELHTRGCELRTKLSSPRRKILMGREDTEGQFNKSWNSREHSVR